jgi:hypothetical protein
MSYFEWDTNSDVPLFLELVNAAGAGVTGATPVVAIKRIKQVSGSYLDGYYWNSASFVATPTFLTMSQVDSTNNPGLYTYCFSQSLVRAENIYNVYFKNDGVPVGFNTETHYFVNEISGSVKIYESEPETE